MRAQFGPKKEKAEQGAPEERAKRQRGKEILRYTSPQENMPATMTLISSEDELDLNGISFGLIIWESPIGSGLFHAKASRPPNRQDTEDFSTIAAARAAAIALATLMAPR